ncbi:glycosyltransferase [Pseudodesulfovibrio tunisiensis]|uniref:glycosyltransferase n=1 Tax=Pseudodesulfovibrio tunisiensis TaxID=463192 RepID=UPI001FB52ED2|nr:glycosyltransferase [Pseudodesulfovibrio tunisiensis]
MKTHIFLPPVSRPTGGITVLRQIADILHRAGREVCLVARERTGWRPAGLEDAAPVVEWADMRLEAGDVWLVPEGWANALMPGLEARARCVSYVQNWAYLFSSLPPGVTWDRLPVEFVGVSDPVSQFVELSTGRPTPTLRPGIDLDLFAAPEAKPDGPVRVAYMPRKNKALAAQIRAIFEHRNGPDRVRWVEIQGMDAFGVARELGKAHVFLMTGFPEGCPLPPLEAMACGCACVGYAGFGGWDYMRQALPGRYAPMVDLRPVDWAGNGLWCADGDVLDAALSLETMMKWAEVRSPEHVACVDAARATARAYSVQEQERAVLALWDSLEQTARK